MADRALQGRLGLAIRDRRQRLGLSQEDLAARCGMHRTYIGSVERGERNISLSNLVAIAHSLDCEAWDLLREAERTGA